VIYDVYLILLSAFFGTYIEMFPGELNHVQGWARVHAFRKLLEMQINFCLHETLK